MLYKLQTAFKTFVNRRTNILHKGISDHINISTVDCWPPLSPLWPTLDGFPLTTFARPQFAEIQKFCYHGDVT